MDFEQSLKKEDESLAKPVNGLLVMSSETLDVNARAEVDMQVSTAKKYPRDLQKVLKNIEFLATQDRDTAESCFYAIKRDGKTITGATVRLAEIISTCWGNMRSQAKIISNDGRTITAQGACWDLETNVAYSVEVRRKITNSLGVVYSEDMQIVTANACCSVALRNAVFKCIPMAITSKIQERIKDVMLGEGESFEDIKRKAVLHFIEQGVKKGDILKLLERDRTEDITREDVFILRGIVTAINDGDTTLKQAFSASQKKYNSKSMSGRLHIDVEEDDEQEIDDQESNHFFSQEVGENKEINPDVPADFRHKKPKLTGRSVKASNETLEFPQEPLKKTLKKKTP